MSPRLRVNLLGDFRFLYDEAPVRGVDTPRLQSLLAYLVLHRHAPQSRYSHLFTVRLWPKVLGDGRAEMRGKVQHVTGGEARYFRDWATLVAFLQAVLAETGKS